MKTLKMIALCGVAVGLLTVTGCSSTETQTASTQVTKKKKAGLYEAPLAGCETRQAKKKKRCRRSN